MKETSQLTAQPTVTGNPTAGAWLTAWRFAGIVTLLILVCFPSVILGLEAFVYGDMGQFAYPLAFYFRESFWHGQLPLWNPASSCGIPFLAQWNTMTCYPLSLFYLLLPMPWSFDVFCLGHMLLAAVGMYSLAYRWTNDRFASALAGTVFGFNGFIWQSIMFPPILAALAWMPWFILAAEKAWKVGGRAVVLAALAGAMQMLSGGAEVIIQTWLILGVLWILQLFRTDVRRGQRVRRILIVGLLVAGLSAVQTLPFLDLLKHSQRSSGYGSGEMENVGVLPFSGIVNFLVPLFHSARNPQGVFVQIGQEWVSSYYVGIGTLMLGFLAVWRVRNWRLWMLAGLTVFSMLMALGQPGIVYNIVKKVIPVLGFVRFPVKFVALAIFTLPLMAAFGMSGLMATPRELWRRQWFAMGMIAVTFCVFMAFVWQSARMHPISGEDIAAIGNNILARVLMLALICVASGLLLHKPDLKFQRLLQCAIIGLLWLDVLTHTSNLTPTVPTAVLQPDAVRSFFNWDRQLHPGTSRALQSQDSFWKTLTMGSSDLVADTYSRRRALSLNYNLLDHVAKFDGFYPLDLKDYVEVFKRVFFTTNAAPGLKDFLGISHVSNPTNILDWVPRDSFLPLVIAGQKPVFASDADTLVGIFRDDFEPTKTIYLPTEAAGQIHAVSQTDAKATLTQFTAQRLDIQTESQSPAMVSVAQSFYHPWRAYMDGRTTQLWRANAAFQAFEVPAGRHHVELRYEDSEFRWGGIISALSAFAVLAMWLWCGRMQANRIHG